MVWLLRTAQKQGCHAVSRTHKLTWNWRGNTGRMSQNWLLCCLVFHPHAGNLKSLQYLLFRPSHMRLAHWNCSWADQEKAAFKSAQGIVLRSGNASDGNDTRQSPKQSAAPFGLWIFPLYSRQAPRASWRAEAWVVSTSHCPWMPWGQSSLLQGWHTTAVPRVAEWVFLGTFVMPFHCTGQAFNRKQSKFNSPFHTQRTANSKQHR